MAFMEEEQHILRWLSQYGPMPRCMIQKLLPHKSDRTTLRIIHGLKRGRYISQIEDGRFWAIDPYCVPDARMLTALWVLTQFAKQIEPNAHRPADVPGQIFFLKERTAYEIIVIYQGEDHLLRLLPSQPDTKYIIVIPNMDMAEQLALPDGPCLLATVEPGDGEEPEIAFYSP